MDQSYERIGAMGNGSETSADASATFVRPSTEAFLYQSTKHSKAGAPLRDDDIDLNSPPKSKQSRERSTQKKTTSVINTMKVKVKPTGRKKDEKIPEAKVGSIAGGKKRLKRQSKEKSGKKIYAILMCLGIGGFVIFLALTFFVGGHRWFGLTVVKAFT